MKKQLREYQVTNANKAVDMEIKKQQRFLDLNHEVWVICPCCGGWYDARWLLCDCGYVNK